MCMWLLTFGLTQEANSCFLGESPVFDPSNPFSLHRLCHSWYYFTWLSPLLPVIITMATRGCHQTIIVNMGRNKLLAQTIFIVIFLGGTLFQVCPISTELGHSVYSIFTALSRVYGERPQFCYCSLCLP